MLIAEDLLLLLTDDATGKLVVPAQRVDLGLGGANLVELTLNGKVDVVTAPGRRRDATILVLDTTPVGDEILDAALATAAVETGKKPIAAIRALSRGLRAMLYERLARSGVLRAEKGTILGVLPRHRWPTADVRHEAETRQLLHQAVVQETTSNARIAALIGLLDGLECVHRVIDPADVGLSQHELKARAGAIAEGNWATEAVRKAIRETAVALAATTSAVNVVVLPGAH